MRGNETRRGSEVRGVERRADEMRGNETRRGDKMRENKVR